MKIEFNASRLSRGGAGVGSLVRKLAPASTSSRRGSAGVNGGLSVDRRSSAGSGIIKLSEGK